MTLLPAHVRDVIEAILPERYSRWVGKRHAKPSEAVDAIQERLRPFFAAYRFTRHSRCFHRKTNDGVTLVVAFQISSWGLSQDGFGRFTINAGVYIPEVWEARTGKKAKYVSDEKCLLRRRIGTLAPNGRDTWWPARDHSSILKDVERRVREHVLPYLARLETREQCVDAIPSPFEPLWPANRAILLHKLGREAEAGQLLNDLVTDAESRKMMDFAQEVRLIAGRLGLSLLD